MERMCTRSGISRYFCLEENVETLYGDTSAIRGAPKKISYLLKEDLMNHHVARTLHL